MTTMSTTDRFILTFALLVILIALGTCAMPPARAEDVMPPLVIEYYLPLIRR